ncbi:MULTISPECIES: MarR family winged helix-turn-helix transcriptional regulator [Sphingomonas]|jgi:MarR family transcriptional regulator, transcriptional regulator for hemolysin|uniref:MarR family transcriptional regulator n=2 Tax=Pseudomonadota TaxID=1224 RepID=A0A7Y6B7D9_9SPHN|nr:MULTISPECIES: MarR family transcriptional regulator [Sphingomonas]MBB4049753.1 MarR family transcriptional regulator for hemolysin [Sphingomonas zeae]MDK8185779.1 MarR family transcriptional regulator [Sphingomonas zeae]MDK8215082.1 MarR family transcriptional regulator [Sphingomonas sp. UMB7805-LC452B]NUU47807.1 MarR family transcriptional regulator [Sphingomonas zeae]
MSDSRSQLERRLATALIPLARSYRRHLDRALAELSLSHSSALAVMLLGRMEDGVRQGMLAEQLGVEGPSVVPLVDQIERAGLAERRADATDKRAKTIHLTSAGRALAAQAEVRSTEIRAALFAGVPAGDLAIAIGVLERLGQAIGSSETD